MDLEHALYYAVKAHFAALSPNCIVSTVQFAVQYRPTWPVAILEYLIAVVS